METMPIVDASRNWIEVLRGKTVAVTGAGGFIGGRMVNRLAGIDCRIIRIARAPQQPPSTAGVHEVTGDLNDRSVWEAVADAGVDTVFHFAAHTAPAQEEADSDSTVAANVMPMRHLLAMSRELRRPPLVIYAGTVTQAGLATRLPADEDQADRPITAYDRQKLIAENDLKAAIAEGIVRGASLRLSNVYGPGAIAGRRRRDVLNRMIAAAIRGEHLTVHGRGEQVRDYVFIDDVIDAFLAAAACADNVNGRHFVIGSGFGTSIHDAFDLVAARVAAITGRRVEVRTDASATRPSPIDERHFVANSARFAGATGWRPVWRLSDGIDRTIEACLCG